MASSMCTALVLHNEVKHDHQTSHDLPKTGISAGHKVFNIGELVEMILSSPTADPPPPSLPRRYGGEPLTWHADVKLLFTAMRINKTCQRVISGSKTLRKMMFLQYSITPPISSYEADDNGEYYPDWWMRSEVHHKHNSRAYTASEKAAFDDFGAQWLSVIMPTVQPNPLLLSGPQQLRVLSVFDISWYTENDTVYPGIRLHLAASKEALDVWIMEVWDLNGASWKQSLAMSQAVGLEIDLHVSHGDGPWGDVTDIDRLEFRHHEATMGNVVRELWEAVIRCNLNRDMRERARQRRDDGENVTCQCELCREPAKFDMANVWW